MTSPMTNSPTESLVARLKSAGQLIKRIEMKGGVAPIATVEALSRAEQAIHEAATLIRSLRDEWDAAERCRSLMAKDWLDFCDSMGVAFDTQEAVAADLRAIISNAERERDAAREALMPFAEFVPDFFDDGYQDDDIVKVESHHGDLDLTLTVADFRRARNIIGEA